jgi:hypothetical protein
MDFENDYEPGYYDHLERDWDETYEPEIELEREEDLESGDGSEDHYVEDQYVEDQYLESMYEDRYDLGDF